MKTERQEEWPCRAHVTDCSINGGKCDECKRFREFYDSALLEAAGLVCSDCAKGLKPERQELRNFGFIWMHLDSEEIDTNCAAGSIHERRAHGKEPKA